MMLMMTLLAALGLPLAMTGCNTVEGAGEDLQSASEEVEEEIEEED